MKILFISRAFPPIIGGIETQNGMLAKWLAKTGDTEITVIANTKGKKNLIFFIPKAFFQALFLLPKHDIVLLGDGVLAGIGWFLRWCTRKPVVSILHGLDLTYDLFIYQLFWVKFFIPRLSGLIAVSRHTKEVALQKGILESKLAVVPNGVEDPVEPPIQYVREDLALYIKENLEGKKVLVTIGRLVRRKGVAWFIEHVLPKLPDNTIYVVAGTGSEKEKSRIIEAAEKSNVTDRVKLLGRIPDEIRIMLLRTCDLSIQPNIPVTGDREGFGIAVIESTLEGLPVVASRLEGLQDAVIENETGLFATPEIPESFIDIINPLLQDEARLAAFRDSAKKVTREKFHWSAVSKQFTDTLRTFLPEESPKA